MVSGLTYGVAGAAVIGAAVGERFLARVLAVGERSSARGFCAVVSVESVPSDSWLSCLCSPSSVSEFCGGVCPGGLSATVRVCLGVDLSLFALLWACGFLPVPCRLCLRRFFPLVVCLGGLGLVFARFDAGSEGLAESSFSSA